MRNSKTSSTGAARKSRPAISVANRENQLIAEAMDCAEEQLKNAMEQYLLMHRKNLAVYIERLKGLSPLDKLNQGFSHVSDANGNTITDVMKVKKDDSLTIHVKNGRIIAKVMEAYHQP